MPSFKDKLKKEAGRVVHQVSKAVDSTAGEKAGLRTALQADRHAVEPLVKGTNDRVPAMAAHVAKATEILNTINPQMNGVLEEGTALLTSIQDSLQDENTKDTLRTQFTAALQAVQTLHDETNCLKQLNEQNEQVIKLAADAKKADAAISEVPEIHAKDFGTGKEAAAKLRKEIEQCNDTSKGVLENAQALITTLTAKAELVAAAVKAATEALTASRQAYQVALEQERQVAEHARLAAENAAKQEREAAAQRESKREAERAAAPLVLGESDKDRVIAMLMRRVEALEAANRLVPAAAAPAPVAPLILSAAEASPASASSSAPALAAASEHKDEAWVKVNKPAS